MGNEESKAATSSDTTAKIVGSSNTAEKTEQDSAHSIGVTSDPRINAQMAQNVLLIWLDGTIDDNCVDSRNTITQLRRIVNTIKTFTDGEECIQFLERIDNNKACIIISGRLGQHIVPRIHNMSQVNSIYIFCGNVEYHKEWAKRWSKIKGVFIGISSICEALTQASQQDEENAIPISLLVPCSDVSKKNLDQLESSFMLTHILKEILLTIKFEQKHFMEFIEYCRDVFADNEIEMKNVKNLERKYRDKTPIWWYTSECFLYSMLNRTLRMMDMDLIIKMGFFLNDLHRHIEQLHSKQYSDHNSDKSFTAYRGQSMLKEDFEKLTKTKGGLISFNNFLLASRDRDISVDFARRALPNQDMVGILFVLIVDPAKSTTPFASIIGVGCNEDKEDKEDKVLFAMHTVFRIYNIKSMGEKERLFRVDLALTSGNDKDLILLTDQIREETYPNQEGWYRLGSVLLKIRQCDQAQRAYEMLLEQTTEESEKTLVYQQIGWMKCNQEEYEKAIIFYQKALETNEKTLPPSHLDLAKAYVIIGGVYEKIGDYSRELSSYEKALEINEKSLPSYHPDLFKSYNNISNVYFEMGEYPKALSSYEKLLKIRQKSLPSNHPDVAMSYGHIGNVYHSMGEHLKAVSFWTRAMEIGQQSLPSNHPHLQWYRNNIERVKK